jgi:CRP/FNR family transcriptional regulator
MTTLTPALPKSDLGSELRGRCAACEIRALSICDALSERELARLGSIAAERVLAPGETLVREGGPASDVFNLLDGTVRLYKLLPDGRRQVTGFLFPGDFLGIALADVYPYSAEAIEPVRLCRFPRKRLEALLAELPRLERRLLDEAARELAAAQEQMLLLGRKTARERVASFLVFLSRRAVRRHLPPSPLAMPMSRMDMGDFLGLTTETVSRTLTQLRAAKLIAPKGRKGIVVLDMDGLSRLVDGCPSAA